MDRVRWSSDELVVLSAQFIACQPWTAPAGRRGLEVSSPAKQWEAAFEALEAFRLVVAREADPLGRLEKDVKGVQLQRRWYGNSEASALPLAVAAMRRQHTAAVIVTELLGKIAA